MCRHLAYLGGRSARRGGVRAPPHALLRAVLRTRGHARRRHGQRRRLRAGLVPRPGLGAGCATGARADLDRRDAAAAGRAVPPRARARRGPQRRPPACRSTEAAAAPFAAGRWLFSHNGVVRGWPDSLAELGRDAARHRPADARRADATPRCCGRCCAHRLDARARPAGGAGRRWSRRWRGRARFPAEPPAHRRRDDLTPPRWTTRAVRTARPRPTSSSSPPNPRRRPALRPRCPTDPAVARHRGRRRPAHPAGLAGALMTEIDLDHHRPTTPSPRHCAPTSVAGLTADAQVAAAQVVLRRRGSELFEQITQLPEYYPTRSRARDPARARAARSRQLTGRRHPGRAGLRLVGEDPAAARRARASRHAATLRPAGRVSEPRCRAARGAARRRVPGPERARRRRRLHPAPRPAARRRSRRLVAFLGGTIGNLLPAERAGSCARCARARAGGVLLLGTDLVKDPAHAGRAPTTTRPGSPRSSTRTCCACSTASSARLRRRRVRARRALGRRATSGSRCGCAPAGR